MPVINRYHCPACDEGFDAMPPSPPCPRCAGPSDWVPERPAHVGALNWEADLGLDGIVQINTIQDANRIERESLRREANGEGSAIVFRALHQDRSNMDRDVLVGRQDTRRETLEASRRRTSRGLPIPVSAGPLPSDWND